MENIVKQYPKVGLLIVGKGKLKPKLMEIVKNKNLEKNIIFPGFIPEKELSNLYSSADIFVLPSLWEVLPISLLEALSCGSALISSDASGNPEIVDDGKNGFVIPRRDIKTLQDRIITLIDDEQKRKEMGRISREIAINKFEWNLMTKKTQKLYDEMGND
jgi:glycosyltransferase involved in cell wall biosynthesis